MAREAIDTIAEEVIGLKGGVKKQDWFDQDCEIVTQEKKLCIPTNAAKKLYPANNRRI